MSARHDRTRSVELARTLPTLQASQGRPGVVGADRDGAPGLPTSLRSGVLRKAIQYRPRRQSWPQASWSFHLVACRGVDIRAEIC
jgi:hypothetical protein